MMRGQRARWSLAALVAAVAITAGAVSAGTRVFWKEGGSSRAEAVSPAPASFAALAEKAMPAVVTIYTKREVRLPSFFFGMVPFLQEGLGSGFIISPDGYILTNNHVVADFDKVKVIVGVKHKKEYDAEVVGADPETDVALVKIDAKNLPVLPLGDSDALRVGDWVAAIGSPYQLSHTFTVGVVSAKGRRRPHALYDDFIQTDASINSGNSGGPLINLNGEAVGINTMIISPSGGNVGIGFAIPINLVKLILPQLKEKGKVERSWLGVDLDEVTPEVAKKAGLSSPRGALVENVVVGSPADKAGLKAGDIIIAFNGKEIEDVHELPALVSTYGVGKKARITVVRDGRRLVKEAVLVKRPSDKELARLHYRGQVSTDNVLGIAVRDLTEEDREALGVGDLEGVLVVEVMEDSPAERNDIQPGDIITKVNFMTIRDVSDFEKAMKSVREGSYVRISLIRGQVKIFRLFRVQ